MIDFFEVAKGILNVQREAIEEGRKIGKAEVKGFSIRAVHSITARKITDMDGHWDGDGTVRMKVEAVLHTYSPTLEVRDMEITMDLEMGKHIADEILLKLKEVELT